MIPALLPKKQPRKQRLASSQSCAALWASDLLSVWLGPMCTVVFTGVGFPLLACGCASLHGAAAAAVVIVELDKVVARQPPLDY